MLSFNVSSVVRARRPARAVCSLVLHLSRPRGDARTTVDLCHLLRISRPRGTQTYLGWHGQAILATA